MRARAFYAHGQLVGADRLHAQCVDSVLLGAHVQRVRLAGGGQGPGCSCTDFL